MLIQNQFTFKTYWTYNFSIAIFPQESVQHNISLNWEAPGRSFLYFCVKVKARTKPLPVSMLFSYSVSHEVVNLQGKALLGVGNYFFIFFPYHSSCAVLLQRIDEIMNALRI